MAWRHEEILQLIELYKDGPELWDPENPDYKNNYKRSSKLHLICKTLKKSQWDVKNKIKNLRTTFYRARKNFSNRKQRPWAYYNALSFIDVDKDNNDESDGYENSAESDKGNIQSDEDIDEFEEEKCVWTEDECLKLIELLKENECLWNSESALYNNYQSKIKAFKNMSEALNKDTPDIKYKIKTLRTVLTRTHKKIQKAVDEHGCYAGKVWFGYEPLSFMLKGSNFTPIKIPKQTEKDSEIDYECDGNNGHLEGTNEYKNHLQFWDMNDTIKLMKMFEKHEELWNPSHKNYAIKIEKQKTLKHFAKTFNRHIIDVSSKLQNLRTQFYREVRKLHEAEISSKKKERVWFGYRYLLFLSRCRASNEQAESETKREHSIKFEEHSIKEEPLQDMLIADCNYSDGSTDFELDGKETSSPNKKPKKSRNQSSDFEIDSEETSCSSKKPKKSRKSSSDFEVDKKETSYSSKGPRKSRKGYSTFLKLDEKNTNNKDLQNTSRRSSDDFEREYFIDPLQESDEFTTFGQYVTQELRKVTDDYTLMKAKNDISNIIFHAQSQSIKNEIHNK